MIISQGANIGGWSLYAKGGRLKYCYNLGGVKHFFAESAGQIPAGEHQVRMEFTYAGGGLGKGGKATLFIDGRRAGEADIPMTEAMVFSADDGCDVGEDSGAPVSPDYGPKGNAFNGTVKGVLLAIAEAAESVDHLVKPEDAIRIPGATVMRAPAAARGAATLGTGRPRHGLPMAAGDRSPARISGWQPAGVFRSAPATGMQAPAAAYESATMARTESQRGWRCALRWSPGGQGAGRGSKERGTPDSTTWRGRAAAASDASTAGEPPGMTT